MPITEDGADRAAGSGTRELARPARSAVHGSPGAFNRPLTGTDFVVVDLETTGGSPDHAVIMEIGAVRVHGTRETAGEQVFGTLIDPGRPIPEHISALTGITGEMVAGAPLIGQVLPAFLRFAAGAVLVAHNAPFDLAFLEAACGSLGLARPAAPVLDTAGLARRVLTTEEAPDCRLGTLAQVFGATVPEHRALGDARATAAVLRGLIGRLAAIGVHTLDGVREITDEDAGCPPGPRRDRMLELTADIPAGPGVCLFLSAGGEVLHVLKSSDMRARVRGYFAVSETRPHISDLLEHTERVCPVTQPTSLAADVAEIRVITQHHPRYNDPPPVDADDAPGAPGAAGLTGARRIVATGPRFDGGWDLAVIEDGLLAASAAVPPDGAAARAGVSAGGVTSAEGVTSAGGVAGMGGVAAAAGSVAERACVLRWLGSPGVRVIQLEK